MEFSKKEKESIIKAVEYWKSKHLLDEQKSKELTDAIQPSGFDWKKLAYYTSIFGLLSLIIAIISIFADTALMKLINTILDSSYLVKTVVSAILSLLLFILDTKYTHKLSQKNVYTGKILTIVSALLAAITFGLLSYAVGAQKNPGFLILLLSMLYLSVGAFYKKEIYWTFGMFSMVIGFSAFTIQLETDSGLFLGLNFPARFVLFGIILLLFSLLARRFSERFFTLNYRFSLLLTFLSLWVLSITGNYESYNDWLAVRQFEFWFYSILLLITSIAAILIGIKNEDDFLRLTGVIFVLICLYTRYFEYFWDGMHKAIFFFILALSFWLIAKKSEKIWNQLN